MERCLEIVRKVEKSPEKILGNGKKILKVEKCLKIIWKVEKVYKKKKIRMWEKSLEVEKCLKVSSLKIAGKSSRKWGKIRKW